MTSGNQGADVYGDTWAGIYDAWYASNADLDPSAAVQFLFEVARGRRVLELGAGTGRVAIPLADAGVRVDCLESSAEMAAILRSKTDTGKHQILLQDMSDYRTPCQYGLIYCVFNSFLLLPNRRAQSACAASTFKALEPNGDFVLETLLPPAKMDPTQSTTLEEWSVGEGTRIRTHHPASHTLETRYVWKTKNEQTERNVLLHYFHPSELDALMRWAGFGLLGRWSDWRRSPLTPAAWMFISHYRKG